MAKQDKDSDSDITGVMSEYAANAPSGEKPKKHFQENKRSDLDFIQILYKENSRIQEDISDYNERMMNMDNQLMMDRELWEQEILDLERAI